MSSGDLPDIGYAQWQQFTADQFTERTASDLDRLDWHLSTTRALDNIVPPPPLPPEPPPPPAPAEVPETPAAYRPPPVPAPVAPPVPPPPPPVAAMPVPEDWPRYGAPQPPPTDLPAYQPNVSEAFAQDPPPAASPPPTAPAAPAATGNAWLDRVGGMLAAIPSNAAAAAGNFSQAAIGSLNAGGEAIGQFGADVIGNAQHTLDRQNDPAVAARLSAQAEAAKAPIVDTALDVTQAMNPEFSREQAGTLLENTYGQVAGYVAPAAPATGVAGRVLSRGKQIEEAIRGGATYEQALSRVDDVASELLPATAQIGSGRFAGTGLLDAAGNPVRRAASEGSGLLGPTGRALPKTPSVVEVVPDIAPEAAPAVQRVIDAAVSTVPPARAGLVDKVLAVTLGNMFTAGTVGVNTVGNVITSAERPLVELFSGHPVVAARDIGAMAGGVPRAIQQAAGAFLKGRAGVPGEVVPDVVAQAGRPEALPGAWGMLAPYARANQGIDQFFRVINTAGATQVARVTGMTGDDAIRFVAQAADTAVLTGNPSQITKGIAALGRASDAHPVTAAVYQGAVASFFPFIRITEEIFKRGALIVASPVTETIRLANAVARADPKRAEEASAKLLMGLGLYWAVWHKVHGQDGPELRGAGTGTIAEQALARGAMDAQGNPILQPEQVELGGRNFPVGLGGQWGNAAALIASAIEGWEDNGPASKPPPDTVKRLKQAFDQVTREANRQYYLEDFANVITDLGKEGGASRQADKFLRDKASQVVPAELARAAQSFDPIVREPTNLLETVQARIPGQSQKVQPRIDPTTGEPVKRSGDALTFFFRSPAPGTPNPVADEVVRLEAAGNPVSVRQFGKSVNYAGADQTPEQRRVLQGAFGKATQTYVADVLARPEYQAATDAQKAATLNKALETAYKVADLKAGEGIGRDPAHQAALAYASIPHYVGVKGTVEEIRQGNLEHANARAEYQRYVKEFGKDRAELELLRKDKETWRLLQHPELDSELLKIRKKRIDEQFAGQTAAAAGALRGAAVPVRAAGAAR